MMWPNSCQKRARWLLIKRQEADLKVRPDHVRGVCARIRRRDAYSLALHCIYRVEGWKEPPPRPQNISPLYKHWAEREKERESKDEGELPVWGGDLERQQRGDREIGAHGKGLVCQLGEAWDHCPVLLCTIIPLNPALLLSLPPIIPPPPRRTHTLTHSSDCSVYWWLKLAVSFRIHSQHWSSGTSGPNGLISTVYSCALSRMTHKGTKRPLCARELFLSSSTGPTDAHCTFLRRPSCLPSFGKFVLFSPGCLSARPLSLAIPRLSSLRLLEVPHLVTCHHFNPPHLSPALFSLRFPPTFRSHLHVCFT